MSGPEPDAGTLLRLEPDDVDRYIALRRRMLVDSPWSFAASETEDVGLQHDKLRARLLEAHNAIMVVEASPGGALVASAGIYRRHHTKMAHRAEIWGVFVEPDWRERGVGRRVVAGAIEHARSWEGVDSVSLSVSVNAPSARRLYERLRFVCWGTEPAALRLDTGERYDEHHMLLTL